MKIKENQTHREMGTESYGFQKEIAGLPKKGGDEDNLFLTGGRR
jgi:hypothetical protein